MAAMLGQPKPLASLSSGLLARKGHASPAMRRQGFGGFGTPGQSADDLGWNDMGSEPVPVVAAVTPESEPVADVPVPPVLIEREALKEEIEAPAAEMAEPAPVQPLRPVSLATAARIGRETSRKGKAAFTLRLDNDRHLRLRLASAVSNRSSQQLVTDALDQFLQSLPEVEALAVQLPATKAKRSNGV